MTDAHKKDKVYCDFRVRIANSDESDQSTPQSKEVTSKEKRDEHGELVGVYWEWDNNYSELDSRIEAPCRLDLDRISGDEGRLYGYMNHCQNAANPFTVEFQYEIRIGDSGFWAVFDLCTKRLGEGGRCELSPRTVNYATFSNSPARRDIST